MGLDMGGVKIHLETSKTPPLPSKTAPPRKQNSLQKVIRQRLFYCIWLHFESILVPKCPRTAEMPPRTPRETPKRLQRAAKRPSWERQGGPKTPQESPGDSQETPRAPKGTLVGCIWTTRAGLGRPQENMEIRSVISQKQSSRSRVVRISREEAPKGGQEELKKSTGSPKEAQVRPKGG